MRLPEPALAVYDGYKVAVETMAKEGAVLVGRHGLRDVYEHPRLGRIELTVLAPMPWPQYKAVAAR